MTPGEMVLVICTHGVEVSRVRCDLCRIADLQRQVEIEAATKRQFQGLCDRLTADLESYGKQVEKLTSERDRLREDAERWKSVLKHLGGSTVTHQDGRTYFCVVVPFHQDESMREMSTLTRFVDAIDAARQEQPHADA